MSINIEHKNKTIKEYFRQSTVSLSVKNYPYFRKIMWYFNGYLSFWQNAILTSS